MLSTQATQAVAISHYGPIINAIQMAIHHKINQGACAWEDQRFRPGDVAAAGELRQFVCYCPVAERRSSAAVLPWVDL